MAKVVNLGRARYDADGGIPEPDAPQSFDQPVRDTSGTQPVPTSGGGSGSSYIPQNYASGFTTYQSSMIPIIEPAAPPPPPMPPPPQTDAPQVQPPVPQTNPPVDPGGTIYPTPTPTYPTPTYPTPNQQANPMQSWIAGINWKYVAMALGALSVVALLALLVKNRKRSGVNGLSDRAHGVIVDQARDFARDFARLR